ncbi:hypothetical protein [Modestobacter sp. VKM Ac-2978]|uniref:hypothetical protein n=1 Tax=Modestobacter sp. VKM Ac-2978 TaxID=3004132 RepID=UPI0022AAC95A|nr:hypothetical protein [Modestobacter sp. VKM Ac-2978]MCZ2850194.1 hypothetical protein [Modestobacter sp. VKM Ac-2978]
MSEPNPSPASGSEPQPTAPRFERMKQAVTAAGPAIMRVTAGQMITLLIRQWLGD